MPRPQCGKLIPTRFSARLTAKDIQQSRRGDSLKHLCQPPALLGKKSSGVFSATSEDTTSPAVMLGIFAALSQMLCDLSSWREISAAPITSSTLPSICWTGTSSGLFARKRKTSKGPSWSPPTAPPIPSATGLFMLKLGGKKSSPPPNQMKFGLVWSTYQMTTYPTTYQIKFFHFEFNGNGLFSGRRS